MFEKYVVQVGDENGNDQAVGEFSPYSLTDAKNLVKLRVGILVGKKLNGNPIGGGWVRLMHYGYDSEREMVMVKIS
jgi:hypothetical protein